MFAELSELDLLDLIILFVLALVLDDTSEAWVLQQFILHRAGHQHLLALDLTDLGSLRLDLAHLIVQFTVLTLQVVNFALLPIAFGLLLSDDFSQILQLLHELDVLVALLVDRGEARCVGGLHISESLLQVLDVTVAGGQSVGELLAETRQVVLGLNSHLAFRGQLTPQRQVFFLPDGPCLLVNE